MSANNFSTSKLVAEDNTEIDFACHIMTENSEESGSYKIISIVALNPDKSLPVKGVYVQLYENRLLTEQSNELTFCLLVDRDKEPKFKNANIRQRQGIPSNEIKDFIREKQGSLPQDTEWQHTQIIYQVKYKPDGSRPGFSEFGIHGFSKTSWPEEKIKITELIQELEKSGHLGKNPSVVKVITNVMRAFLEDSPSMNFLNGGGQKTLIAGGHEKTKA